VKEILRVTKDPNISSLCSWEEEYSYKQQRREMHFLCMPFQPLILRCSNMKSLFNIRTTKMFLKRKMKTHYLNISHMIVWLIWKKECTFGPIYNLSQNELLALPKYIDKNLEKGFIWHSKFPTSALILFVKKRGWIFMHVCWLLWTKLTHHQDQYLLPLISRLLD